MPLPSHSEIQSWGASNGASDAYDLRMLYAFARTRQRVPGSGGELATFSSGLEQSYGAWAPAYASYLTANGEFPPDQATWANWLATNGVVTGNHAPAPGAGYVGPQVPATVGGPIVNNDPVAKLKNFWNGPTQNKAIVLGGAFLGYSLLTKRRLF